MLAYLPVIQQLLEFGLNKREKISGVHLILVGLAFMIAAMVMSLVAIIFLMIALHSYLATFIVSPYADALAWLSCGGVMVFATIVLFWLANSKRHKHGGMVSLSLKHTSVDSPVGSMKTEVYDQIKDHPLVAILLASLAGAAAGEKLH